MAAILIKKYGNRRLYDTGDSRYITLEELAEKVRGGADVRVVDSTSGEDLTQATLTQVILESGSAHRTLPVPLLVQMIRLGDDSLSEFFSRYVTGALELYLGAKRGVQQLGPVARVPMNATDALARLWMQTPMGQMMGFGGSPYAPPPPAPDESAGDWPATSDDVASLRRELDQLKKAMRGDGLGKPGAKRRKGTGS